MKENNYTGLIPENTGGKEITVEAFTELSSPDDARSFYEKVKDKFLYIHNWGEIAGALSPDFQLTDNEGNEVDRNVQKGDHFRIDIPGPGSHAGNGFDWAFVEDVKEVHQTDVDSIAIRVRPAENPKSDNTAVAHFLSKKSTSTFVLTREGSKVIASIYDRNIEANDETEEPLDKLRNAVVGLTAKYGMSKLQWQALVDAFVKKDEA